ncbi:MAG: hypothetical protein JOZ99_01550 [Actinobacteria bacterium]|nr:hypothetical protein [Actinomycetota bacterium]
MIVFAIVTVLVVVLIVALGVAITRDPGPSPAEVALGYEQAWDRLDFDTLWSLSTQELRDGRARPDFVAAKRAAYRDQPELRRLARHVTVEESTAGPHVAVVITSVELHDGAILRDELKLVRRGGRWQVLTYGLRSPAPG